MLQSIKNGIPPLHAEGKRFVYPAAAITVLLIFIHAGFFAWVSLILTSWLFYFFRDPIRQVPVGEGLVMSPADGRVSLIESVVPPVELDLGDEPLLRVSIFLNVFNVHVNRVPVAGVISRIHYIKGKFLNAELDKASIHNERNLLKITCANGKEIGFVQIAGLVARRILWHVTEGQQMAAGERFGLIRFGSRMDVYLPKGVAPLVVVGQTAVGGETILADLSGAAKSQVAREATAI